MSIPSISFWQADRNWYIQQRVSTLSARAPAPAVPAVDQSSPAAREAGQAAALSGGNELKSAAISALELSSSAGYTSALATNGLATNDVTTNDVTTDVTTNGSTTGRLLDRVIGHR
jgi:hypothetical protein